MLDALTGERDFAPSDVPRVVALVTAVNKAVFAFAPAILGVRELSGGYAVDRRPRSWSGMAERATRASSYPAKHVTLSYITMR